MKRFIALAMLMLCLSNPANARALIEQQKIDYLITSIANLKGAVFIRNGTEYDAKKAAEHLHEKLDYAGEKIKTANEFIDRCATASWLSKRKYLIRFSDGHTTDSSLYLHGKLKEYERTHPLHEK